MSRRKSPRSRTFSGNHQRSWLWGRHAVTETLRAGRWPIMELLVDALRADDMQSLLRSADLHVHVVDSDRLSQLCGSSEHQGVVARMGEFPCHRKVELLADAALRNSEIIANRQPLFVMCDRIQDAHNFGAILRCCDAMSVDGIIIGQHSQAAITPHVARSSSGAINHLMVYRVDDLADTADQLARSGFSIVAATEKSATTLWDSQLNVPAVLVVGTESSGISESLLRLCDVKTAIPMLGQVNSLNAAVAVGILLTEFRRQQMPDAR